MKDLSDKLDTILKKYRDIEKDLLQQDKLEKDTLIKYKKMSLMYKIQLRKKFLWKKNI